MSKFISSKVSASKNMLRSDFHHGRIKSWDVALIVGDPFFLATVSIATIGWAIAFISSIAANAESNDFARFAWWTIVFQLLVTVGVVIVVGVNSVEAHRVALVGFISVALAFTCSIVNSLVYSSNAAQEAAAAGYIFLSMVNIVWIYYFGTTSDAAGKRWMEAYAPPSDKSYANNINAGLASNGNVGQTANGARPGTSQSLYQAGRYGSPYPKPNEPEGEEGRNIDLEDNVRESRISTRSNATRPVSAMTTDYAYRAKAIYSYDANEEDPNEVSFLKGEILEVSETSGKWWPVRKQDGTIGIAPSNYVVLI